MKWKSQLVSDLSGSMGGLTASRNRFGPYFRTRVAPVDPNTARQNTMRTALANAANAWMDLTPSQRTGWEEYASAVQYLPDFCGAVHLTGQQQFLRSNTPRYQAELDPVYDAPTEYNTGVSPGYPTLFQVDPYNGTVTIHWDFDEPLPADGQLLWFLGRPQAPSRNFYKGPYQLAGIEPVSASATGFEINARPIANVLSDYTISPNLQSGTRSRISYADGRLSHDEFLLTQPEEYPVA